MEGKWRTTRRDVTGSGCPRTCGEEVLEATPFIFGYVRANRVISTSQEFLTLVISIGVIGRFAPLRVVKTLPPHPLGVR